MNFQSLTNVKPSRDLGTQIIVAPTEGQFKVTPDAAKKLDVVSGDYLHLATAGEDTYVAKGEEGVGAKLGTTNKAGAGNLNFSSANSWNELDGSTEHNTHYSIAEEGVEDEKSGRIYYKLEFSEKVEKQQRKSSLNNSEVSSDASESVSEESPVTSFGDM